MRTHLFLLAVMAAASACSDNAPSSQPDPCNQPSGRADITVDEPADPPMQLRIESCRVDVDACKDLCNAAMQLHNVGGVTQTCNVTFDSGHAYVSAIYSNGCAFAGGGAPIN